MILVSRTLSDGRQLEIRTTPDREVITTIGGVVQSGFSGGMFSAARPFIAQVATQVFEWECR